MISTSLHQKGMSSLLSLVWALSGESRAVTSCVHVMSLEKCVLVAFFRQLREVQKEEKSWRMVASPYDIYPVMCPFGEKRRQILHTARYRYCTFCVRFLLIQNSPVCSRNARMTYFIICFPCGRQLQLLLISKMDLFSISPFNLTSLSLWLTGYYTFTVCTIWC